MKGMKGINRNKDNLLSRKDAKSQREPKSNLTVKPKDKDFGFKPNACLFVFLCAFASLREKRF